MKKQILFAMMAIVAVLFAACELNGPYSASHGGGGGGSSKDTTQQDTTKQDTIGGDTIGGDTLNPVEPEDPNPLYPVPTVTPTQGAVTVMIKFDQPVCEGMDVVFVGKYNGCNWAIETASRMTPVNDGWYKVVIAPDAAGDICGRPVMYDGQIPNWDYTWVHDMSNLVSVWHVQDRMIGYNEFNELTLYFEQRDADAAKVVYIESKAWKLKPCETPEHEYRVTLYAPEATCGFDFDLEILGTFCGWESGAIAMTHVRENIWMASFTAHEGDEYKIRGRQNGVGNWDIQVMYYVPEEETYYWFQNQVLGSQTDIPLYYSDDAYYIWSVCLYGLK